MDYSVFLMLGAWLSVSSAVEGQLRLWLMRTFVAVLSHTLGEKLNSCAPFYMGAMLPHCKWQGNFLWVDVSL